MLVKNKNKNKLLLIERVLLLKSLSIFIHTPENVLAEVAHLMYELEVEENEEIVTEGEVGNCMFIIYSGEVRVHKENYTLATLKEKDFFGELALLDTETRSATVTAKTHCILYRIDQEPFYDLMEFRPEVVKGVVQSLCKRLRDLNYLFLNKT